MSARADTPPLRSLIDIIPAAYVPLYHSIRSPLVCVSICARIVSIVYPSFNMHSKTADKFLFQTLVWDNKAYYVHSLDKFIGIRSVSGALN